MRKTTFIILCLEGALLSFNVAAAAALIPSIALSFSISQFVVGKIIWLYMLPYGIAALIYGPLIRIFDAKKIELICMFFFSVANLLVAISWSLYTLFLGRFFMGVFGACVIPLTLILIATHINSDNRGKFIGIFFSATFIASLLGLFLSSLIPWRLIFLIPSILGLLLCLAIYFYLPSFSRPMSKFKGGIPPPATAGSRHCREEAEKEGMGNFKINYLSALRDKRIISIFIYIFFISMFYHGVQQWLGVYFSSRFNLNQFLISMLIMLSSLSGIFGEVIGGWLSDVIGRIKTINLGVSLMIISVFLLILKSPFVILALIMIIWGLGWTFNHVGISTKLTDLPREFLNEAASLNSSVRFVSGGMGSILAGALMNKSFNLAFIILGVCLLSLLIFSKRIIVN